MSFLQCATYLDTTEKHAEELKEIKDFSNKGHLMMLEDDRKGES